MEFIKRNTDYALRALVFIAENGGCSMGEIAEATGAPEPFLRKVFRKLGKAGVVVTTRGAAGGVSLSKEPKAISVLEIIEAVQGPVAINKCFVANKDCANRKGCGVRRSLCGVQTSMIGMFRSATVDTLARPTKKGVN